MRKTSKFSSAKVMLGFYFKQQCNKLIFHYRLKLKKRYHFHSLLRKSWWLGSKLRKIVNHVFRTLRIKPWNDFELWFDRYSKLEIHYFVNCRILSASLIEMPTSKLQSLLMPRSHLHAKPSSINPFRTKTPKYLFPRGNKPLLYHQIGNRNFFIFITNQ